MGSLAQEPYPPGCEPQHFDGIGLACEVARGLLEVFAPDGTSLGFTHRHADVAPTVVGVGPALVSGAKRDPFCVTGGPTEYYSIVIYARAADDADRYATVVAEVRDMVKNANFKVDQAAQVGGRHADLKVLCDGSGQIIVRNEVLPTSMNLDGFSSITNDLRNKGYTSARTKHWVYYDDGIGGAVAGQGNIYSDDRLILNNNNNGVAGPMFSITYGYLGDTGAHVMLHELGHNLGAVQNSAPHSTGGFHCTDGWDTMCYNDGGPQGALYTTSVCGSQIWDCNKDDYFNVNPAPGNYLATHWNIGNPLIRFLVFDGITLGPVTCPARGVTGVSLTCTFQADSLATDSVRYTVNWGDGATTTIPATGYVPDNTLQSAAHTFTSPATYTVQVTATNDESPPLSESTSRLIDVRNQWAPEFDLAVCPVLVAPGTQASCQLRAFDTDGDDVRYTVEWGDGETTPIPANGYVTQNVLQTATHSWPTGLYTVRFLVEDDSNGGGLDGIPVERVVDVRETFAPVISAFLCEGTPYTSRTVRCDVTTDDTDSPTVQHLFVWGDGTSTTTPPVAPGTAVTISHTYAGDGVYTVRADAFDPDALRSEERTRVFDGRLPQLALVDPDPGQYYVGCQKVDSQLNSFPLMARSGCITVTGIDTDTSIQLLEVTVPSACPGFSTWSFPNPAPSTTFEYPICATTNTGLITAKVWDADWNGQQTSRLVWTVTGECAPYATLLGPAHGLIDALRDIVGPGVVPCGP